VKKIPYKIYSLRQYKKIYGNTVEFLKFIEKYIDLNKKNIIDLACGGGANTIYLAKKYPQSSFLGIDYNRRLIAMGNKFKKDLSNVKFKIDDWNNINSSKNFIYKKNRSKTLQERRKKEGGIISFQAISFLDMPITKIFNNFNKKKFPFLAFSSLFYEGKVDYKIYVEDLSKSEFTEGWYNIYSIHTLKKILIKKGYKNFKFEKFNIQYDLPKPMHGGMQSYTVKSYSGKRMIFSGALHIPYAFFLAY
jgi:SAM-dependent methyltransferase